MRDVLTYSKARMSVWRAVCRLSEMSLCVRVCVCVRVQEGLAKTRRVMLRSPRTTRCVKHLN